MPIALPVAAAAVAGATAASAYLDAKFHVRKDVKGLMTLAAGEREFAQKAKNNRNSLWYNFEAEAKRLPPTEQAIWSRGASFTWQETHANACRYGQFLHAQGIQPGQLCAFYLQNSAPFVFSTLGSWAIGSAPALINYNLGGAGLVHCLKISGARVLLVDEDEGCRQRIEEVREEVENAGFRIVVLDAETRRGIESSEPIRPGREFRANVKGDFPMCLMYTSGSTGMPKACPFTVQRASGLCGQRVRNIGLNPGPNADRWYNCMPLYHGTGHMTMVACMVSGVTLCVGKKFSTSGFWKDIRDSDATAFVYVGETARYLLAAPPSPLDKQHRVKLMFGNGLRPDVWRKFGDRFGVESVAEFFNSTEGVFSLLNLCKGPYLQSAVGHHGALLRFLLRNTYVPVDIDHETGAIVRDPQTGFARRNSYEEGGEIIVKMPDPSAFSGYWGNEEATAKKFERDVFTKGDLYYRTGDALRRTSDGRWYFMDRLGDTYRWKSENVATAEVAQCMGTFPGIVEAIVYGVEVPGHDGRAGCAAVFIPPDQRQGFDFAALLAHLRKELPKYAVPVFLRLTSEMSPMHNNKQNKVPLKKEGIDLDLIEQGEMKDDRLLWLPSAVGQRGGDRYTEFRKEDLDALKAAAKSVGETARL
ncbi:fatty acid transporter-like protein [Saccharata proteae CBS 121410]|uniref:Very long-chain fatty acid transport protein n=1 Tax=Saccharata proteae CBS 121410 TaxID=1314787 RepID=A0A9P4HNS3_9PEZI|nr:fatty acid transporter-like protein [Saccharata proteae CBS 121410]